MAEKKRVVSGMRPTGRMHLGNYWGALKNWIDIQDKYDCMFFVADWHALTTGHEDPSHIAENTRAMVADWLACGLDPEKSVIYRQSEVPEIAELSLLLNMITPVGWLLRNPTFKEQLIDLYRQRYAGQEHAVKAEAGVTMKALGSAAGVEDEDYLAAMTDFATAGFLAYPVLMTSDIVIHKGEFVPVGRDQIAHVEISRDIARRFKDLYGVEVFPEPQPLLTEFARIPGLDSRKMSKSYKNALEMGEEAESLRAKVMTMFTDPNKKRATDAGNPEGCVVFAFHKLYNPGWQAVDAQCRSGASGCVACKKLLVSLMAPQIEGFRVRRAEYDSNPALVDEILERGAVAARKSAQEVLSGVRRAMRLV